MWSQFLRVLTIAGMATIPVGGCSDILPYPSFGGPLAGGLTLNYVQDLKVPAVTHQVECEIRRFIKSQPLGGGTEPFLDPSKVASVQMNLQTDLSGTVSYIGIDLSKIGLTPLADLIAQSNKVSSLQAKTTFKGTVSSQIELNVPQALSYDRKDPPLAQPPLPARPRFQLSRVNGDTFQLTRLDDGAVDQAKPAKRFPGARGLGSLEPRDCVENIFSSVTTRLFIDEWLSNFVTAMDVGTAGNGLQWACMTKITLKSQFQVVADVSAGVNPFFGSAFLLPVSGLSGDINPSFTHSAQITFTLNPKAKIQKNPELCVTPPSQAGTKI
jgi:hypothetical protein